MNLEQILNRLEEMELIWSKMPSMKFYFVVMGNEINLAIAHVDDNDPIINNRVYPKYKKHDFVAFQTNHSLNNILGILERYTKDILQTIAEDEAEKNEIERQRLLVEDRARKQAILDAKAANHLRRKENARLKRLEEAIKVKRKYVRKAVVGKASS